jgi:hypothetical protein
MSEFFLARCYWHQHLQRMLCLSVPHMQAPGSTLSTGCGPLKQSAMAQGCMGTEQTRRSKRAVPRQYSHDDKEMELAAKEEDELKKAIERSKRKHREQPPKEKTAPAVCTLRLQQFNTPW